MEVFGGCIPALCVWRLSLPSCLSFAGAGVGWRMVFLQHLNYLSRCCHTILDKSHSRKEGVSSVHSWRAHSPAWWGRHGGRSVRQRSQGSHRREMGKDEVTAGAHFSFFFFSFWLCIRPKIQAGGMVLATLGVGLPSAETPGNVLRHMHSIVSWWTGKPATVKLTKLTMTMNYHS